MSGMNPKAPSPWPPRALIGHVAHATCADRPFAVWKKEGLIPRMPHSEYLSLEEHTHLLAEAVRDAKAQTIQECKDRINEIIKRGEAMQAFSQEHFNGLRQAWGLAHELPGYLEQKASELRKGATPENGGKDG